MDAIESIIFDWGGVLIDNPAPGLMRYLADAFGVPKAAYTAAHEKFGDEFQKGMIGEEIFWERVCGELNVSQPKVATLWGEAFRAVYRPKTEMFRLVRSLRDKGFKTALLSNAELPAMEFFYQQGYEMFNAVVFSCAERLAKPEREFYEVVLRKLASPANRSVFIDDRGEFVEGAKEAGLGAILYESSKQVKAELSRLGVNID